MQINLRHKISSICMFSKRQFKQSILWRQSWRWWWQWWRWSGGLPWCWWRPALPAPPATSSSAALAFRKAGREDMRHAYLLFESSCSISVVVEEATILWNSPLNVVISGLVVLVKYTKTETKTRRKYNKHLKDDIMPVNPRGLWCCLTSWLADEPTNILSTCWFVNPLKTANRVDSFTNNSQESQ